MLFSNKIIVGFSTGLCFGILVSFILSTTHVMGQSTGFTYYTKWGSLGEADGQFHGPSGLSIDANDNIYVTDKNNNRVQIFSNDGQFIGKFGVAGAGDGQLNGPEGVGVDKDTGTVYVADTGNTRIQVFKPL